MFNIINNKYTKKMSLKVTERLIVIGIVYIIFQLFNIKLTVGI